MRYKIKQIKDIKNCDYSFEWWDWAKEKFSLNDYEVVYEGEIEAASTIKALDDLYVKFNINPPKDFRGHSLSVSDVVELDGINYYCDNVGWKELEA